MKKLLAIVLVLMLLPAYALGEGKVINLAANPDQEWSFREGVPVLEMLFPPVKGADACIVRMGDEVMMIDSATAGQRDRVKAALEYMNIDRVDVAFNTHPHDDHIVGFQFVPETAEIGKLVITFPEDANFHMQETLKVMKDKGIPVEHAKNGDVLKLGEAEMEVIQCSTSWFSENNRSAMLMVKYGDCRILMAADVELDGQNELLKTRPDDLKADILKYPHHGVAIAGWNFLKHVGAELTVITNSRFSIKETRKDADRKKLPQVYTAAGMVRLRSDGEIWVVDQLPLEEE